jgi:hypothetical protein
MRLLFALLLASPLLIGRVSAQSPVADAAQHRNEAQWAEQEAEARMTDGDYDGAVLAQQQANADWQQADRASDHIERH